MNNKAIKLFLVCILTCILTSHTTFAADNYKWTLTPEGVYINDNSLEIIERYQDKPNLIINTETMSTWTGLTKEQVIAQLDNALYILNEEEQLTFNQTWANNTPQDKHDYLLPLFHYELFMNYAQVKMMVNEIKPNSNLGNDFFNSFESKVDLLIDDSAIFANLGSYDFGGSGKVRLASMELKKMIGIQKKLIQTYNGIGLNQETVENLNNQYETSKIVFESMLDNVYKNMLLREYGINISSRDRMEYNAIIVHAPFMETFDDHIKQLQAVEKKWNTHNPNTGDLYSDAAAASRVNFNVTPVDDPFSTINEHGVLTPLGISAASNISLAGRIGMDLTAYKNSNKFGTKRKEFIDAVRLAETSVETFKIKCNDLSESTLDPDVQMDTIVNNIHNTQLKIATDNGYASWFYYELALEKENIEHKVDLVIEKANELAWIQQNKKE